MATNPYGTLGPSPGRVAAVNAANKAAAAAAAKKRAQLAKPFAGGAVQNPYLDRADIDAILGRGQQVDQGQSYGGGGTIGGMPDAYYQQMASMIGSQGVADKASTKAAIQQALIGFGLVPQSFKDELGALDDTTRALIQKNTDTGISGYARLLQAAKDEETASLNALASKGLRRSGAKGNKLRRLQLKKDQTTQDAIAALLQEAGSRYSGYASNEGSRQMQLLQNLYSSQAAPSYNVQQGQTYAQPQQSSVQTLNPYYKSIMGPSPYQPKYANGSYAGGASFATQTENPKINPIFWFK